MRYVGLLCALLLLGCEQWTEVGSETTCTATADCAKGLVCLDQLCVDAPNPYGVDPEAEREADEYAKLGVERDILESRVQIANESLVDATREHKEAEASQRRAALQIQRQAAREHADAKKALEDFLAAHSL